MLSLSLSIDSKYIASRMNVEGSFITPTQRKYDHMKPMTACLRPHTVRWFRGLSPIQISNGLFARNYMEQYPPWIMYAVLTGFVSLWLYSNFWINLSGRLPLFMRFASWRIWVKPKGLDISVLLYGPHHLVWHKGWSYVSDYSTVADDLHTSTRPVPYWLNLLIPLTHRSLGNAAFILGVQFSNSFLLLFSSFLPVKSSSCGHRFYLFISQYWCR